MVALGATSVAGYFASTKSEGRTCQEQRTKVLNWASLYSKRICSPGFQSLAQLEIGLASPCSARNRFRDFDLALPFTTSALAVMGECNSRFSDGRTNYLTAVQKLCGKGLSCGKREKRGEKPEWTQVHSEREAEGDGRSTPSTSQIRLERQLGVP
jgi:hypothetical protein